MGFIVSNTEPNNRYGIVAVGAMCKKKKRFIGEREKKTKSSAGARHRHRLSLYLLFKTKKFHRKAFILWKSIEVILFF